MNCLYSASSISGALPIASIAEKDSFEVSVK